MSNRPFEADQAAGLRQLFASRRQRVVAGFIGATRNAALPPVINQLAAALTRLGKQCAILDEQPAVACQSFAPDVRVLAHPGGAAHALDSEQLEDAEFLLVHAYPSVDSAIHRADLLVIVETAPLPAPETTRKILRATRRLADRTGLLLIHQNDKAAVLSARLDVERLSQEEAGQRIHWLGAIPARAAADDLSAHAAATRLTQWQPATSEST